MGGEADGADAQCRRFRFETNEGTCKRSNFFASAWRSVQSRLYNRVELRTLAKFATRTPPSRERSGCSENDERPVTLPRRGTHRHGLFLCATTHTQRHNTRDCNLPERLSTPAPRHADCACERGLDSSLEGVPLAVVQYNPFQGDGSASASGVVSLPAEPAAARVVFKSGRLVMPSAANGSIIAVSYEARARGVTRFFRGREAIAACPEIVLVQVPTAREQCCHSNQLAPRGSVVG